jgi:hypothetical protein
MLSSRFSHKSVDIFVYIYFLNYNSCYRKGKTNNLTKRKLLKKHLSKHKNRIPRILCAPEYFLTCKIFCENVWILLFLHMLLLCFEQEQSKANSISLNIFYFA